MNILLLILIIFILIGNIVFLIHYAGLYPFTRETRRQRETYYLMTARSQVEKKTTHGYQVLSAWNDLLRRHLEQNLYDSKDPASVLDKTINQYQENPSEENFDRMIHLSNHISNRVRYDEKIDALIEKISSLTVKNQIKS